MSDQPDFSAKDCAAKLFVLSAPERLEIVHILSEGSHTVGEIAAKLNVPAVNVSHHLNVLCQYGFLERIKRGRHVYCQLKHDVHESNSNGLRILKLGCCQIIFPDS